MKNSPLLTTMFKARGEVLFQRWVARAGLFFYGQKK